MNYILEYPWSFLFYMIFLVSSVILSQMAKISKTRYRIFLIMLIIILTLFGGLRNDSVGTDTLYYKWAFTEINKGNYELLYEPGFVFFSKVILIVSNANYTFLFIIIEFLTVLFSIIRLWELRDEIDFVYSIFIYYCIFYLPSFNIMRQALAMALLFWGTRYLFKEQYLKFLIVLIISVSIHLAAIVCIAYMALYLIIQNQYETMKKNVILLLSLAGIVIPFTVVVLQMDRVQYYMRTYFAESKRNGKLGIPIIIIVVLSIELLNLFIESGKKKLKECGTKSSKSIIETEVLNKFSKYAYIASLVVYTMLRHFDTANRISRYFLIFELIYYTNKYDIKVIQQIKRVFVVFFALYSLYVVLSRGQMDIMPYTLKY